VVPSDENWELRIGQIPMTFFVQEDSLRSAGVSALPWTGAGYCRGAVQGL
jgi:hypothetical protein